MSTKNSVYFMLVVASCIAVGLYVDLYGTLVVLSCVFVVLAFFGAKALLGAIHRYRLQDRDRRLASEVIFGHPNASWSEVEHLM